MSLWLLIKRELTYNRFSFMTGVFSLVVATACLAGILTLLRGHDIATEQIVLEKEKELRKEMVELEDDYRRIMRRMGYNVLILHEEQSIPELKTRGYPTTYFDYEDAWILAESDIQTLNHLLPVLQEKVYWEEAGMEIMLSGVRGQVPVYSKPEFLTDDFEYRSPIMERIPEGKADAGYTIATALNLSTGQSIDLFGEAFTIHRIYAHQGTANDITVWIPLDRAQEILGREGKINGIFALECVCDLDELGMITEEVKAALPHAQVFEFSSLVAARADVRQRAARVHERVIASVMNQRMSLRGEKERFASIILSLILAGAGIWIFVLIYNNVRERKAEIAILRAVGLTRQQVLIIFLSKALIMGLIGGIAGCIIGIGAGIAWSGIDFVRADLSDFIDSFLVLSSLLLAPALSFTAGFIPAVLASNQDPADILRGE